MVFIPFPIDMIYIHRFLILHSWNNLYLVIVYFFSSLDRWGFPFLVLYILIQYACS